MTQYTDKTGKVVKLGDILRYDEGTDGNARFGKAIHEVVEHKNALAGVHRIGLRQIGYTRWEVEEGRPSALKCYCAKNDTVLLDAIIIGNVKQHPERLTPEYAVTIFPEVQCDGT